MTELLTHEGDSRTDAQAPGRVDPPVGQAAWLRLSQALLAATSLGAICEAAARLAAEALQVEHAGLALIDPGGQTYTAQAVLGVPPEVWQQVRGVPLEASPELAQAVRSGQVIIVGDHALHPEYVTPAYFQAIGITSSMLAPMLVDGAVIGGLSVMSCAQRDWTDAEAQLLAVMANHTALALERQRLFGALRASEARYRTIAELTSDFAYTFCVLPEAAARDGERRLVLEWVSEAFVRLTGITEDEARERGGWHSQVHPADRVLVEQHEQRLLAGQPEVSEYRLLTKSGEVRWVRDSARPEWDMGQGRVVRLHGAAQDITAQVQAEDAAQATATRFRALLENSADGIALLDAEGHILYEAPAVHAILGYRPEELIGRSFVELLDPEVAAPALELLRQLLVERNNQLATQIPVRHKDGSVRWLECTASNLLHDPAVQALVVNYRDVTERQRAEAALRASESKFRGLLEAAPDGCVIVNTEGRITFINSQAEAMFGYTSAELLGQLIEVLVPERYRAAHERYRAAYVAEPRGRPMSLHGDLYGRRRDGTEFPVDIMLSPLEMDGELVVMSLVRDITAPMAVQVALEHQLVELTVLHAVATVGAEAASEDELIARVTQVIGETLYPDDCGVLLLDEASARLYIHHSYRGVPPGALAEGLPLGQGVTGHVAATGRPLRVADVAREPRYWRVCGATRSELCVPLKTGEQVLGVINVESTEPDAFSQSDERLLATLAGQLATAIARLRSQAAARRRTSELEAVARVSAALRSARTRADMLPIILDQVLDLLHADSAALALIDPQTGEAVIEQVRGEGGIGVGDRLSAGSGVIGQVIATGQAYITDCLAADLALAPHERFAEPMAAACLPLITDAHVLGALWVARWRARPSGQRAFSNSELRLLTAIGDMAASAIHRTTLYEETQRRLVRLAALHSIDSAISASLDLRVTLDVFLDQVTTKLGLDAAAVLLLDARTHTLEYAAGRGFRGSTIARARLRLGEGYAGRAAMHRQLIQVCDLRAAATDFVRADGLSNEGFVGYSAVPLLAKGQVMGVLELFSRAPLHPDAEWPEFLETLAGQAAIAIDNAELFDSLQRSHGELSLAYEATIEGWSRALDLRDKETEGHTQRVTELTLRLASALGVRDTDLVHIRRGALLHDIGKMGIPDSILLKPGPLTDEEWAIMRLHPIHAYQMLAPIRFLRPALDIPYCHHEKWDGSGYPQGLKGEAIPLAARIFAVVDVWDALRSNRPYRPAWSNAEVRAHLRQQAGQHFDPRIVEAFLQMVVDGDA